jgi:L-fucose isomerase-like protein
MYSGLLVTTGLTGDKTVTIGRIANYRDRFKMHIIEGRTEALDNFHEIECPPYPGVRIYFKNKPVSDFKDEIMSQHYIMVYNHYHSALKLFCDMKNIEII